MSGEEEPVFGPARGRLGGDDVGEPGHGDLAPLYLEDASLPPDFFELESFHYQSEIDLKRNALASHQRPLRHDPFCQKSIEGGSQRLVAEPQRKPGRFTDLPRAESVSGVRREK